MKMENIYEAAEMIHKLKLTVHNLPGFDQERSQILETSEKIKTKLLKDFSNSCAENNLEVMKNCATALLNFDDGLNLCINDYINQHPFFFSKEKLMNSEKEEDLFLRTANLCTEVVDTIQHVFRRPEVVMARFLQRIFEQKLSQFVDESLKAAGDKGVLCYLNKLTKFHQEAEDLKDLLQKLDVFNDTNFLERLTESLFLMYKSDGNYIQTELYSLKNLSSKAISQHYQKIGYRKEEYEKKFFQVTKDVDKQLCWKMANLDVCLSFIQYHREALERCQKLSAHDQVAANCQSIFENLLDHMVTEFLEPALDAYVRIIRLPCLAYTAL
jgi:hypothetical protein